jgi:hypothetical protein
MHIYLQVEVRVTVLLMQHQYRATNYPGAKSARGFLLLSAVPNLTRESAASVDAAFLIW